MELRPYQREAVEAVYEHLRTRDTNPCVVLPTAAGKTPCLATICRDAVSLWNGRVLIIAHVKELLEQALDKLRITAPDLSVGLYSASLKRRELNYPVTVAGIQSIYRKACDLGPVDLIIVDECFVEGTLISTPAGDVPIEHIQPGMTVHNATGIGTVMATSARKVHDLVTLEYSDGTVLTCTANHPIFTESGWRKAGSLAVGSMAFGRQDLRVLRQGVSSLEQAVAKRSHPSDEGAQLASPAVLFDLLFEDPGELHEVTGSPSQSLSRTQAARTQTTASWWERRSHAPPAEAASTPRPRVDSGIGSGGAASQGSVTAQEPEDRYCQPAAPDCHRIGRSEPPIAGSSAAGHAKDALPRPKRLVRVSHHKCAGGRSVFNLHVSGHPSYFAHRVLVHNCHLIPADGEGMYRTFIGEARVVNPHVRVIGLTATPFRMNSGMICAPDNILNEVCYEIGVRELIVQGYLCPLRTKAGIARADMSDLHVRAGDFVAGEVENLMDVDDLVQAACAEIVEHASDRRSVLIFTSGVRHGQHVVETLRSRHGVECGWVDGQTPIRERDAVIDRFKAGGLKYLANCNVLTTGFDAPAIDCVAMMRPTMSPGLYYQMVGRGFRLHPDKSDCLVLDFGGNILRHGPVDALLIDELIERNGKAPMKECPGCHAIISAGYLTCPECGYEFPPPARNGHDAEATSEGILSDQVKHTVYEVTDVWYEVHHKRGNPDAPPTMRVYYECGFATTFSEWICFEHSGYPRRKAESWWVERSNEPVPDTVDEAVDLARCGTLAPTLSITITRKPGSRYDEVVGHVLGPKPPRIDTDQGAAEYAAGSTCGIPNDSIPF